MSDEFPRVQAECVNKAAHNGARVEHTISGRWFVVAEKLDAQGVYLRCACSCLLTAPAIDRMAGLMDFFQTMPNPILRSGILVACFTLDVGGWGQLAGGGVLDGSSPLSSGIIVPNEELTVGIFAEKGKLNLAEVRECLRSVAIAHPSMAS